MKAALLIVLLVVVVVLLTILYMLFQPGAGRRAASPSQRSREAAVGRAVIAAARKDLAVAAMVRAAVGAAPQEDQDLAAPFMEATPNP